MEIIKNGVKGRFATVTGGFNDPVVIIDKETGIEYLSASNGISGGITVLLNPDGTPRINEKYNNGKNSGDSDIKNPF